MSDNNSQDASNHSNEHLMKNRGDEGDLLEEEDMMMQSVRSTPLKSSRSARFHPHALASRSPSKRDFSRSRQLVGQFQLRGASGGVSVPSTARTTTRSTARSTARSQGPLSVAPMEEQPKLPLHKRIIHRIRHGRSYGPNDTIRKLPPKKKRYWAWKYEVLRPWEPHPPKNYYKLVHSENPWFDKPPSQLTVVVMLLFFLLYSCTCAFFPWLLNLDVLSHRLTVLKVPSWMLPWWFHIFAASFTHINNAVGIWFIYLTGGFRKHLKKMIPWFLMLACQALWPDILFSWKMIAVAAAMCSIGWILSLLTIFLFTWKMGYAGFLIAFFNVWVGYECAVLFYLVYANGATYTF